MLLGQVKHRPHALHRQQQSAVQSTAMESLTSAAELRSANSANSHVRRVGAVSEYSDGDVSFYDLTSLISVMMAICELSACAQMTYFIAWGQCHRYPHVYLSDGPS